MISTSRLLGLAFASADALIELDGDGVVTFAAGSGPVPEIHLESWVGRPLSALVAPADDGVLARILGEVAPGVRSEAAATRFVCPGGRLRRAVVRAFQLPELAQVVSCSLNWDGEPFAAQAVEVVGLTTPTRFLDMAREALSGSPHDAPIGLAFVHVPGLAEASEAAGQRVEANLQAASRDGRAATRLTPERFAVLRDADRDEDLLELVRSAGTSEGTPFAPTCADVALPAGAGGVNALRALRFTIEGCLRNGDGARPELAFGEHLKRTLSDADGFTSMVRTRQFDLHWQPIVDLTTRQVHHFEGLARFGAGPGPAPVIRMAEELGLIEGFDLAVAEKAVARLMVPGSRALTLAVNVSAHSLAGDGYVSALLKMTQRDPELRRRLMIEVTETAAMADVDAVDRRLAALRTAGVRACIDDFGAGAASFDWLRGLAVDMVKIDGGFVRRLDKDPRASTLIEHLASLCASLNVELIGEMIEDEPCAERLRSLGVHYGQGWLFGRAEPEPAMKAARGPGARRVGAVETWG